MTDDIQQRIDRLERDKRWWKRLAIGLMFSFTLVIAAGGFTSATLAVKARRAAEVAYRAAERARQEAQQQRLRAEPESNKAK
jgi:hypothetical protein